MIRIYLVFKFGNSATIIADDFFCSYGEYGIKDKYAMNTTVSHFVLAGCEYRIERDHIFFDMRQIQYFNISAN